MLARAAAVLVLALTLAPSSTSAAPRGGGALTFLSGDPHALDVRVERAEPLGADGYAGALLWLEVHNRAASFAEPTLFEVRLDGAAGRWGGALRPRLTTGQYGCAGRVIPPGGRERYPVLVAFPADAAKRLELAVVRASFFDAAPELPAEPVGVRAVRADRVAQEGFFEPVWHSFVTLENRTSARLEVVLELELDGPGPERTLVRTPLAPDQRLEVDVWEADNATGLRARSARVVDWTAYHEDGAARAHALVRDMLAGHRGAWPAGRSLGARFAYQQVGVGAGAAYGDLRLPRDGAPELHPVGAPPDATLDGLRDVLKDLARVVAWPSPDELDRRAPGMTLWSLCDDEAVVRVERDFLFGHAQPFFYGVRAGRPAWSSVEPDQLGYYTHVRTEACGDGWLVRGWEARDLNTDEVTERVDVSWTELAGEQVPARATREQNYAGETWDYAGGLELDTLERDPVPGPPPALPSGALADALRVAWDAAYRYPPASATLTGEFQLKTKGGAFWLGERKLAGSFRLEGFTGTSWARREVVVEGKKLTPGARAHLAAAVGDRLLLWCRRDPAALPPFEAALRGVTLSGAAEALELDRGPWARVVLSEGRLVELHERSGVVRAYQYKKFGGDWRPVRITSGAEVLRVDYKRVASDWLLPVKIDIESVLESEGEDETLTLSRLDLELD